MPNNPVCEKCLRRYRVQFDIKDEIWAKLPKKYEHSSLCMECFLEELEKTAPNQELGLNDFCFLSFTDLTNAKFGGPIMMNNYGKDRRIHLGD